MGDMLGDGHISRGDTKKFPNVKARLEFTFSSQNLAYLNHLKFMIYSAVCTSTKPTPWPNPETTGKKASQYWFSTKQCQFLQNCIVFGTKL